MLNAQDNKTVTFVARLVMGIMWRRALNTISVSKVTLCTKKYLLEYELLTESFNYFQELRSFLIGF